MLLNNESTLRTAICELVDNSNTKAQIARKFDEYFAAGTSLVWVVDPKAKTVRVHTAPRDPVMLGVSDVLDGGDVLPGLQIPVRDLFRTRRVTGSAEPHDPRASRCPERD